jgi:CDP-diacylglycerol---glycerol-3-phosphate 3-phosphatidyltransferase
VTPELGFLAVAMGLAVISMGVFGFFRSRGALAPDEDRDRRRFLLGPFFRDWFFWALTPVLRLSLAMGATPFFYNLLGLAFALCAGAALAGSYVALGGWFILLGGICDSLDGRVARARDLDGPHGAFLDSVIDRFAEVAVFIGLAVLFSSEPSGLVLVTGALGGSLLVSYTRARGESLGVTCTRGVMQRAERIVVLGLAAIGDASFGAWFFARESPGALLLPCLALVAVGTLGTAVYRAGWIARRLRSGRAT